LRGNWSPTPLQKKWVKYYTAIISISNSVTDVAKENGITIDNFTTIYNGIDVNAVLKMRKRKSEELRKELNVSDHHFLIGIIGNFKNWKGQHIAVEAAKLLKDKYPHIKYLFIGAVSNLEEDKRYYHDLKEMVHSNGLDQDIIFTGFRTDIPDIISVLDILVHTSIAPEPFGRVILEGMIFSKPVIATAHGGPLEIIEDGVSGFLIPPSDPKALANKIEFLISNPAVRQQAGSFGRKRVEDYFNLETNVKQIEQLYSNYLGDS
jgi:glycosyltransferase involved in cell wall biosynthesis